VTARRPVLRGQDGVCVCVCRMRKKKCILLGKEHVEEVMHRILQVSFANICVELEDIAGVDINLSY